MSLVTVAAVTLHALPLDFTANRDAILEGIREAKAKGATLVVTGELCIPGYGCLDHHLEADTFTHSWEMLSHIIQDECTKDIIVDVGMGCRHRNVRYNSRVIFTYKRILLIRPKQSLAQDGLYREMRHFTPWSKTRVIENYYLEEVVGKITNQKVVPFGDALVSTLDTCLGTETCEELFQPNNTSISQGLNGAEIISNSSASHSELRKLGTRLDLIANSTRKLGGCYVYANLSGVDGDARIAYDGSSMIILNGRVIAQDEQFSLKKVSVITATIDLEEIRSYRSSISRNLQAAAQPDFERIEADIRLSRPLEQCFLKGVDPSKEVGIRTLGPMEEIWKSTGVWLWQYLATTNSAGFLLPLSGGLDSLCTALMVFGMARLVLESTKSGNKRILAELRRVTGEPEFVPQRAQDICSRIFHTVYMGTCNSGQATRSRARHLAEAIGSYHSDASIDDSVNAHNDMIVQTLGFKPQFSVNGGSNQENLALQNIQARNRMVFAYSLAQLSTTARQTPRAGTSLLVVGSANVDEMSGFVFLQCVHHNHFIPSEASQQVDRASVLRGYLSKYDTSSCDLSPLGSLSKTDVRRFAAWAKDEWGLPILAEFLTATPTAELLPTSAGEQSDEVEMGLTYDELSTFGVLRKQLKMGPYSAYLRLLSDWRGKYGPREVADKVMHFFRFYAINRHKSTVITPSLHLSAYNPDDNRHDLRPFLYNISWPWQFERIRNSVSELEENARKITN